jgi:DNA-binding transcriptional LysR family regulator
MDSNDLTRLRRLVIFANVVQEGNFTRAAKALGMNRSNVSEQVSLLEGSLSVRLLHRSTRDVSLTVEGEQIYPYAKSILESLSDISTLIDQEKLHGRIRVTSTTDFAIQWLVPRLNLFNKEHPDILFDVLISDNELNLVEKQIDLAVRISTNLSEGVINHTLFEDSLTVIAAPDYFTSDTVDIEGIKNATWFMLEQTVDKYQINLHNTSNDEPLRFIPQQYHVCDSPIVMRQMVMTGMGIGLHLPKTIEKELQENKLKLVMPELKGNKFSFSLTYSSREQLPFRVKSLIHFLKEH